MYIKIHRLYSDEITIYECDEIHAQTDMLDEGIMRFEISNKEKIKRLEVEKALHSVFIENNNGKTIESYRWKELKYPDGEPTFINKSN